MIKRYPNHADHPLTTVGRLTNIYQHYRFTDDYLSRLLLDDTSFKSILKDHDPTLYDKLIQLFKENQTITMLPGIEDNFSWKKCLCVEPCATGEWTIQQFLKEFKQHRVCVFYGSPTSRFDAPGMKEEEHVSQQESEANVETPKEPRCRCDVDVSGFGVNDKVLEDLKSRQHGMKEGEHVEPKRISGLGFILGNNLPEKKSLEEDKKMVGESDNNFPVE